MLNQYPLWKYLIILVVILLGGLYALPNLYGTDPAIQIAKRSGQPVGSPVQNQVKNLLEGEQLNYRRITLDENGLLVRFSDVEQQLKAKKVLAGTLGTDFTVAQNIAAATPSWLKELNALPMYLGLDLRGGLHFLMEVDTETIMQQSQETLIGDIRNLLRKDRLRVLAYETTNSGLRLKFRAAEVRDQAREQIRREFRDLLLSETEQGGGYYLIADFNEQMLRDARNAAVQQNITTLRNRVNELGVAEPIIQQQGEGRIVVQLPGIQDSAKAKEILSATATLEFRMVDERLNEALSGRVPPGTRLYKERNGRPVLLKKRIIITGDQINDAGAGFDDRSRPSVNVTLNGAGARSMAQNTKKNLGKPMAVVFIEHKDETRLVDGKSVNVTRKSEEVINIATIEGIFSKRFQITGLDNTNETQKLALLLRAGALAAPIRIIEERTIGPSLGADNINKGVNSVIIGMILVVFFMVFWYRGFGLVANVALALNLVLIVAVLSMLQATLTLPGIAGIVLTVGMAVDANVLIFERIREELRIGNTPQSSINAGYEKALSTIADANITTLIAAIVLFTFGTGPIKGFAVTLSIGIMTSMFTAIMVTRSIVNLYVSGRRIKTLSI